jgi:enoyl-CoA hydratase/carnithine racemase
VKRTRFVEYEHRYANNAFELSDDGVLLMRCHTDGGSLVWDWNAHDEMSDAFADVAGDRDIKVLIHTGTGQNYNADWGRAPGGTPTTPQYRALGDEAGLYALDEKAWYGRSLLEHAFAVEVPVTSAVNGPCNIHSEIPLIGDIVLASEDAYFQDLPQRAFFPFGGGMAPLDRAWDDDPWST